MPALVAVNAIRILPGWLFVLLYAAGKLPAPFAPSAGWGDIFAGVAALPLAWSIIRFGRRVAPLVFAWSVIGIADLIMRSRWRLSAPGPLQTFAAADERHHDHPALAHRSRIPGAEPNFHSRRHCL